jgi:four helix bundle protein
MEDKRPNVILEKTINFSLEIISYCEGLESERKYVIARQLLKSGTSIGANIHEAQNAESRNDFIHKMKIAAKEIEETKYWLILCNRSELYPTNQLLYEQVNEIGLIVYKIISSSKNNK